MKRSGKCIAGSALVGTLALVGFAVTSSLSGSSSTSTRRPDIVDFATGTTAGPFAAITQPDIEAATVADFKYPTAAAKDPVRWLRPLRACALGGDPRVGPSSSRSDHARRVASLSSYSRSACMSCYPAELTFVRTLARFFSSLLSSPPPRRVLPLLAELEPR